MVWNSRRRFFSATSPTPLYDVEPVISKSISVRAIAQLACSQPQLKLQLLIDRCDISAL